MSWSISIPNNTPKGKLGDALDAIDSSKVTQGGPAVGLAEAVDAAKAAISELAKQIKRANVSGGASGHCLQPDEGKNMSDHINVSLYGSDPV